MIPLCSAVIIIIVIIIISLCSYYYYAELFMFLSKAKHLIYFLNPIFLAY